MAREQTDHWIVKGEPTWLLVANYGEVMIFKAFDPNRKQLGTELRVLKISQVSPLQLQRVTLGKLARQASGGNQVPKAPAEKPAGEP
jgi:hypothetical protein